MRTKRMTTLALVAVALAGCGTSDPQSAEPLDLPDATTTTIAVRYTTTTIAQHLLPSVGQPVPDAVGSSTRLLDTTMEVWPGSPKVNFLDYGSVEQLADASTDVVVGRLISAQPNVRTLKRVVPEGAGSAGPDVEYDGLRFNIASVLKGDRDVGDEMLLALPAVVEVDDGSDTRLMRAESAIAPLFARGLSNRPDQHTYLLFVTTRDGWEPVVEPVSPDGVAEVLPDGAIVGLSGSGPLSRAVSLDDVERSF